MKRKAIAPSRDKWISSGAAGIELQERGQDGARLWGRGQLGACLHRHAERGQYRGLMVPEPVNFNMKTVDGAEFITEKLRSATGPVLRQRIRKRRAERA
jgi:hypothetical protein